MAETEPKWLNRLIVDAIQEDQRQQHGGNHGVLNDSMIESALARPRNRFAYSGTDFFECAACYVFRLAKNHGYQDANKRTGFMAGATFLRINGYRVSAGAQQVVALMVAVATPQRQFLLRAELGPHTLRQKSLRRNTMMTAPVPVAYMLGAP